jgi:hypothetical protein
MQVAQYVGDCQRHSHGEGISNLPSNISEHPKVGNIKSNGTLDDDFKGNKTVYVHGQLYQLSRKGTKYI